MTDDELLKERIISLEESVSYFSSSAKADRELWVCDSFLRNLGIHDARARLCPMDDDPPDVAYLDLRFEVKEILDPGRRRHAEYKLALERARVSKSLGELAEVWNAEPIPLTKFAETVTDLAAREAIHYAPSHRRSLDLLCYVNYMNRVPVPDTKQYDATPLAASGWRSVSLICGLFAWVLYSAPHAPDLLRNNAGKPYYRDIQESQA
jgi:hypothetical protein